MFAFRQRLDRILQPWFKRRAPLTRDAKLTLRNVYIFLSKEGGLYAFLLLITFVAGINYANNLVLGLCFLLASLLVITIHYTFAHLVNLQIKLVDVRDAEVGGKVEVRLQVSSEARQPHRQIRLSFAKNAFDVKMPLWVKAPLADGRPHQSESILINQVKAPQIISLWLRADQRGRLVLPRLTVSTVYPLGILQAWSYVFLEGSAWVYPAPLAYTIAAAQFSPAADEQTVAQQTQVGQDDFDQLDRYIGGESLARVSWAHVARGQGLMSKRFSDEVGQQQCLDYYQMPAITHEDKLRQLRYGIDQLSQNQVAFIMRLPEGEGVLGQGQAFRQASLLRLAKTP